MVTGVLIGILMLMLIIMCHELGHFIAGKSLGFAIEEFAIGFGPKILKWKRGETLYSLRCLPLGGFCKFVGEDTEDENPRAFNLQPKWRRIVVLIAGGIGNFVAAALAAIILLVGFGDPTVDAPAYIGEVYANSPAAVAGLQPGDLLIAVNGEGVKDWSTDLLKDLPDGSSFDMTVRRGKETLTLHVNLPAERVSENYQIGLLQDHRPVPLKNIGAIFSHTGQIVWDSITGTFKAIGRVFQGHTEEVGGPVMIVREVGVAYRDIGPFMVLLYAVLISVNLGLMNLLPLPALDGARVLFILLEALRGGKKLKANAEGMIHFVGLMAFMGLAVVVLIYDITRIAG